MSKDGYFQGIWYALWFATLLWALRILWVNPEQLFDYLLGLFLLTLVLWGMAEIRRF